MGYLVAAAPSAPRTGRIAAERLQRPGCFYFRSHLQLWQEQRHGASPNQTARLLSAASPMAYASSEPWTSRSEALSCFSAIAVQDPGLYISKMNSRELCKSNWSCLYDRGAACCLSAA